MDPFEVLGFEPSFDLQLSQLAERQRSLSGALHPDRFVGRPAGERRAALGRAIEVNEAHRALKNPLSRAEALLARLGLSLEEGSEPPADPMLLMDMMEKREELRALGRAGDEEKVQALRATVLSEEKSITEKLSAAFTQAAAAKSAPDAPEALEIHRHLGALRYYRRFLDEAEAILDELV